MAESKLNRALRAMEEQHAAGNVESARKLAVIVRSLQSQAVPEDPGLMGQVNRGIAEGVGGLVDFVNPFDKQMGSAKAGMSNLMESGGIDVSNEAPEGFFENLAYGTGAGASAVIPAGVGAKALQGAGGLVGQVAKTVTPQMLTTGGTAAEIASAATSSAASGAAREAGYGPTIQQLAGVIGGFGAPITSEMAKGAGNVALMFPTVELAATGAKKAIAPFTKAGSRALATESIQNLAGGPKRAGEMADRADSKDNPLGLSPAQMTGDEGLISLERAAMASDPNIAQRVTDQRFESDAAARQAFETGGDVTNTQSFIDKTIEDAKAFAFSKIPSSSTSNIEASNIVAAELRKARDIAKEQQRAIWGKIPKETQVDMSESRDIAQSVIDSLNVYDMNDAPAEVMTFLNKMKASPIQKVGEMNTLSSKLKEAARNARSGENVNANTARIADDVADAIDVSFDRIAPDNEVNSLIVDARKFSREMHKKFSRGAVGKLLTRGSRGNDKIDPKMTLQKTMGQGGDTADIAEGNISTALAGGTGVGGAKNATADYLRNQFKRKVFPGNKYSEAAAVNFADDNKALLSRFPEVAAELQASMASQSSIIPRNSIPGKFSSADPDEALSFVIKSDAPAKEMSNLIAMAKADESGEALLGLKQAMSKMLINESTETLKVSRGTGVDGAPQTETRGTYLSQALGGKGAGKVAEQLYSKAEMSRLKVISKELEKLDRARLSSDGGKALDAIEPNVISSTLVRIIGAKLGAKFAGSGQQGLQAAQLGSGRASKLLARLTNDKARQLLINAVEDPKLFKDLLRGINSAEDLDRMIKTIMPYVVGTVAGQPEEEEEQ
jgi:hypothetical protein